jgi:hypothetical protein
LPPHFSFIFYFLSFSFRSQPRKLVRDAPLSPLAANAATAQDEEFDTSDVSGTNSEIDTAELDMADEGGESEAELTFELAELEIFTRSESEGSVATERSLSASLRVAYDVCALPDEVIVCVTRFLRLHDVMSLLETSRRFNRLCSNKDIWHHLYFYYEAQLGPMFEGKIEGERGREDEGNGLI